MMDEAYRLFLQCPQTQGALVLGDEGLEGVLLKKDLEISIKEGDEDFMDKALEVPPSRLEDLLFSGHPRPFTKIPCLDPEGRPLEQISYEEFVSEFHPEDYRLRFSLQEVFRSLEHPVLVLNRFKTVLYANEAAEELFCEESFGSRLELLLEGFAISSSRDRVLISRGGRSWIMVMARSHGPHFLHYFYQFVPLQN